MGDIDGRDVHSPLEGLDLITHLFPKLGIEVTQGLVQEHDLWLVHEGAGKGHALLLSTGKFWRRSILQSMQTHYLQHIFHSLFYFYLGAMLNGQWIGHVLKYRHVGPNGIGLKNHSDGTVIGRNIGPIRRIKDHLFIDADIPAFRSLQPSHTSQRRGLTTTAGPQQRIKGPLRNIQGDALQHMDPIPVFAKILFQSVNSYHASCIRHSTPLLASAAYQWR